MAEDNLPQNRAAIHRSNRGSPRQYCMLRSPCLSPIAGLQLTLIPVYPRFALGDRGAYGGHEGAERQDRGEVRRQSSSYSGAERD